MNYKQFTYNSVKINVVEGNIANLKLLQVSGSKAKLSQMRFGTEIPSAIINCSFFTSQYAIGRNQGDVAQSTSSFVDKGWLGFALKDDLTYKAGKLDWWDVEKSACGFTPSTINVLDGQDVQLHTTEFNPSFDADMKQTRCESAFGILNDEQTVVLCTAESGLTGYQVEAFLKSMYKFDFLCFLDNGGSTQMNVNGSIVQKSLDGTERAMFNGLALIKEPEKPLVMRYPCIEGWGSQGFHSGHKGLDFGWVYKANTEIQACADGIVEFEGYYSQKFASGTVKPIGVLIRHPQFSNEYDYISIYWHLASTSVDIGQTVKEGQKIGIKGNSGLSSGTHLHFQLLKLKKGEPIPDQHNPSAVDAWGKVSIDPTPLLRVHPDQLYMQDKSQFKLQEFVEEAPEVNEPDVITLEERISQLEARCDELVKEVSDNKELRKIAEDGLKKALDDNYKLADYIAELELSVDSYSAKLKAIKDLLN